MRNFIATAILVSILAIAGSICGFCNRYERTAEVVSINHDEITFEDEHGNYWVWIEDEKTPNLEQGDEVTLKMNSCGTENDIFDDEIIKIVK